MHVTVAIFFCFRPSGYIEFEAMRNWQDGQPNYGVLLLATNEATVGRGTRFYSNAYIQ